MRFERNHPVLTPAEARQASPRRANLWVLAASLSIALVLGTGLVLAF